MKTKKIILSLAAFLTAFTFYAQPPGSGWGSPKFADEFSGNSLNENTWRIRTNGVFKREQIQVNNGTLKLRNTYTNGGVIKGGWIDSKQKFAGNGNIKYGFYEARVKIQWNSNGRVWPTWWIWGNKINGSSTTEIDVMEYSGFSQKFFNNRATSSHHFRGKRKINGKSSTTTSANNVLQRNPFEWHRWGVLWTPNELSFFYDGKKYMSSAQPGDARAENNPLSLIFSTSPHTINADPEQPDNPTAANAARPGDNLPALEVDWVRVWTGGNAGGGGGNNGGGNAGGGNGTVVKIPGTLEAENNKALNGGVRIVDVPGGKKGLGYIKNNTWSEHFIEVPSGGGTFAIDLYGSSGGSGGTVDFTINGNKLATLNAPKTNGWNDYKKLSTTNNVRINGGVKTIRLVYKGSGNFLFNVDGMVFRRTGSKLIDSDTSNSISVANNPVSNGTVSLNGDADSAEYSLHDVSGANVSSGSISGNSIDVSGLSSGVYILQIISDGKTNVEKLVIQ